jgi:DnaJ family protein C protein 13
MHWSESKKPVLLELAPSCIYQREQGTSRILTNYDYKDIDYMALVSDVPNGFVISNNGFNRLHLFQCDDRETLIKSILEFSGNFIGISMRVRKETITLDTFWNEMFGKFRYTKQNDRIYL